MSSGPVLPVTTRLLLPFRGNGGLNYLVVIMFILINSVVAYNAIVHNPRIQYDADGHEDYIHTLAQLRLPSPDDSSEFFVPPLPYLFPAAFDLATSQFSLALKLAQILNVALSLGVTYFLLRLLSLVAPGDPSLRVSSLFFLGLLPVYYRTMAYVRGEPFVLFFTMVSVYLTVSLVLTDHASRVRQLALGMSLGCLALSRQWGLLIICALIVFLALHARATMRTFRQYAVLCGPALIVALVLTVPYYLSLAARFGTPLAFNQDPESEWKLSNQPSEFYVGLGLADLFTTPVRPHYANQLIPTLYSDTWGDYWFFFLVSGKTEESEIRSGFRLAEILTARSLPDRFQTNRDDMVPYLGRVNRLALLPSVFFVVAMCYGAGGVRRWLRRGSSTDMLAAMSVIVVCMSLAGYVWFLVRYPAPGEGNTIKATYIVQIFPFLAVLSGLTAGAIQQRSRLAYAILMALLVGVLIYTSPAYVTRYCSGC